MRSNVIDYGIRYSNDLDVGKGCGGVEYILAHYLGFELVCTCASSGNLTMPYLRVNISGLSKTNCVFTTPPKSPLIKGRGYLIVITTLNIDKTPNFPLK